MLENITRIFLFYFENNEVKSKDKREGITDYKNEEFGDHIKNLLNDDKIDVLEINPNYLISQEPYILDQNKNLMSDIIKNFNGFYFFIPFIDPDLNFGFPVFNILFF